MSIIWVFMVVTSLVFAFFTNSLGQISLAFLEGANEAIQLSILLAGPLCLWSGVMKLLEKGGGGRLLSKVLHPVMKKLFPKTSENPKGVACLCGNISANLLGLGNAATPMGIEAVAVMKTIKPEGMVQREMYRLVVMNTASIQLLPTTLIALRSSNGCKTPWDILPGVWITSSCALVAGLMATKILGRWWRDTDV